MDRSIVLILAAAMLAGTAFGQADALKAYEDAKAAFEAGRFAQARDLAETASRTDPRNPEIFLLLGKAHYQLGAVEKAVAAWKEAIALAPEEPYAKRMVEVLRGERRAIDSRIDLVRAMVKEGLFSPALKETTRLLAGEALSVRQRVAITTLAAEALIRTRARVKTNPQQLLQELLVLYPEELDKARVILLLGLAKLKSGGQDTAGGLGLLEKVVADHPTTPAAASARFALLKYDLQQGVASSKAGALAQWLEQNAEHREAPEARSMVLDAYLTLTRQGARPNPKTALSSWDAKALELVADIEERMPRASEVAGLTERVIRHLNDHYASNKAYSAAVTAVTTMLEKSRVPKSRLLLLRALGNYQREVALSKLVDRARAGTLPVTATLGSIPDALQSVVAVYDRITTEFPAHAAWAARVQLAVQVRPLAAKVLRPNDAKTLTGPDGWAIDLVLPAVTANADAAAVKKAVTLVLEIVKGHENRSIHEALTVSGMLLNAVAPTRSSWSAVMTRHAELLAFNANRIFNDNVKAGRAAANAELSEAQKSFLAHLAAHVTRDAHHAPAALHQLHQHLQPWIAHGHWAVAEEAYRTLAKSLPDADSRLQVELAIIRLWIQQVTHEHGRLLAAGMTVPRSLDPTLGRALRRCYELQSGLEPTGTTLKEIRALWDGVVNHYTALGYHDVAEAAVTVKAEKPIPQADEYAAYRLAVLGEAAARRELERALEAYGAFEKIVLSPAFKDVITAYERFITNHPKSDLVPVVAGRIFGIAQLFEQQRAYGIAAGIYGDCAQFASGVPVLAQAKIGTASTYDRASFAVAAALDAKAREALKQGRAASAGTLPPAELSQEFQAAIAAYEGFVEAHAGSPLVGNAIGKVMAIAYQYATIDAWAVADAVYRRLLESKMKIRHPERLMFCRGLCQLGQAMPAHAREILKTLTETGLQESTKLSASDILAYTSSPARGTPADPAAEKPPAPAGTASRSPGQEGDRDRQLLAMINRQESSRATRIAQLRDNLLANVARQSRGRRQPVQQAEQQAEQQGMQVAAAPVLSEAEVARQEKVLNAAYEIFQKIRAAYPDTPSAEQARAEILVMVGHWRTLAQWQRAAGLARRFLADNSTDAELPKLRLEIARDRLAWAATPITGKARKQELLGEVAARFDAARAELTAIVADFPKERAYCQEAQWDLAGSFLKQARVVDAFSPTLARGQFVRAAKELRRVAALHPDHPKIGTISQLLWTISQELEGRGYFEEAIVVWNELTIHDPMHALAQQAALKIAQTYHQRLQRPLRAAEAYQELNYARGGNDQGVQNAIFQIGRDLKTQKRWVEALHILETFVNSFPRHAQAGPALTMVGQIHQVNEAWEDAIAAYRRVIEEFKNGTWVQEAKWSIAECTINLSRWREAMEAYREYVTAYPKDAKSAEAKRRVDVLKDLVKYQALVDEEGQRKAFDAQYQIAAIVASKLANQVKAIIEYRKVATGWPESHLADDALYAVGTTYLSQGETGKAREALFEVAKKYPASPLADDALFMVGKSYEDEAGRLATVTREKQVELAKEQAQRQAYRDVQFLRGVQSRNRSGRIAGLKKAGKAELAQVEEAGQAANWGIFNDANVRVFAQKAFQEVEALTATQLADRQDKINAALRKAVDAYTAASKVAGADKAGDALLKMATIYDQRLKDSEAAMATWLEIVRQFSGTAVAEDASWKIAQYHERKGAYAEAIDAYTAFLRNYRRSPRAGDAQFAIAESYEHLGQWVNAMDSYTNYINNFPKGPLAAKAKEQINWIKTYRL